MAGFNKVHGDARPVVNLDSKEGFKGTDNTFSNATGIAVNPAGPKLDFFCIDFGTGSPVNQMGTSGAIEAVLTCIGQLATVHMYQVNDTTDENQMSVAVYPTGAWTVGTLETAIGGLGTVNTYDMSGARVVDNGFKLVFENYC